MTPTYKLRAFLQKSEMSQVYALYLLNTVFVVLAIAIRQETDKK